MQTTQQTFPSTSSETDVEHRLREFAYRLAESHPVEISRNQKSDLLKKLKTWGMVLRNANALFKTVAAKDVPASRAAEWMLDNYYIIKQTLRQIEEDLPANFLFQLPVIAKMPPGGSSQGGQIRIFALARAWIGYSQSQVDLTQAAAFIKYYQQVAPLTIGELWALPIMLRIGVLERLVDAAAELTGIQAPKNLIQDIFPPQPNDILVANSFLSLRLFSATDWKVIFEQTSRVEQILRTDPAEIYANMDFETRNSYRGVVEELARHSNFNEEQVTLSAIGLAQLARSISPGRDAHVGFYLRDAGRATLEKLLGYRPEFNIRFRRTLLAFPTITYLGSIAFFCLVFVAGLLTYAIFSGGSPIQILVAGLLGLGLAMEASVTFVHWQVTHRLKPQSLPRMDFSTGIPAGCRTMVVVPSFLESPGEVNHLLQELELYYLSNSDPQLTFALLTDFGDAPTEHMPEDEHLKTLASIGIENLNQKYPGKVPFYLFHRRRQWNPSEGVWMGWERKRGKLVDFNHLLLSRMEAAYSVMVGDLSILADVKYVVTLDADTSLPQDTAKRLIATLAHPLNQAQFSADGRSVVAGYTVLQPRVAIKPTSANRSLFSRIFSGNAGFDLYSFAVSDVYQDLFGEGSYVGKGIYDVAAFERSLAGQVRQNTLLSHDLFEGSYGRAALVTDIILYEEYPTSYPVYMRRLRRWIRGDWQLLPWLLPLVRTKTGLSPNRLSIINLWKIFDNLRRSLLPPTLMASMAAGWLFLPGSALVWTILVLLPSFFPIAAQTIDQLRGLFHNSRGRPNLKQLLQPSRLALTRWALAILFLPYESLVMLGAIRTTLARLLIARRHMLQWTTAANSARAVVVKPNFRTWLEMTGGLVLTVMLGAAVLFINPAALWVALPLIAAWLSAPQIAYIISRPITHETAPLTDAQSRQVRRLARRTWAFFEQFVGPNDHWLPPDHFQESPRGNVAHYTTPTNIGLFLVSTLSAYDLGYLGLSELAIRLRSTFETLEKLEHYRGHLLNWYDSQTLAGLPPRYISTVDSGNLAACLMTLQQGLLALTGQTRAPLMDGKQWQGLMVILDILSENLQKLEKNSLGAEGESFEVELNSIYERVSAVQDQPAEWTTTLTWLSGEGWARVSHRLLELLEHHPQLKTKALTELQLYLDLLHNQLKDMQRSLALMAPWLSRLDSPFLQSPLGRMFRDSLPEELPRLGESAAVYERIQAALALFIAQQHTGADSTMVKDEALFAWCQDLDEDLALARMSSNALSNDFKELVEMADAMVTGMDFRFLFNERRQVFHIGYNAGTEQLDPSYYDLLASEARIASLIAIAKGDVPQSHWQHLGRPVTEVNGKQVLLSWSGTMFEYLMPTLFVKNYAGTFLSDSCYTALEAQVSYGEQQKVPWGISESGYYAFDLNLNYQYRAFGVPNLGYKRDQPEDLVITPYASLLGLSLQPQAVLGNLEHLERLNLLGRFGLYEALDYTGTRLSEGQTHAAVQSYMAHHQGMILVAICNYLLKDVMVRRFHADAHIRSVELLLQEKIPQNPPLEFPHSDEPADLPEGLHSVNSSPWRVAVDSPIPQAHLLSQGNTSVMITNAGGGYSQWGEFALTRWQADTTLDQWGTWIYVQDRDSGALWSATCQPVGRTGPDPDRLNNVQSGPVYAAEQQDILFYPHKVEFPRSDYGITLRTGITVSTDGVEIRRVNILNDSDKIRHLKLISYGEVVLAAQAADRRHPAFNKLFIESEYLPVQNALLFERRPRIAGEKPVVLIHAMVIEAGRKVTGDYEVDRAKFLGRSQTPRTPLALRKTNQHLPGDAEGALDPIFSLAQEIDLNPHAKTRVTYLTLAAATREDALEKLSHYQTGQTIHRAFDEARAASESELTELGLNSYDLENTQRLLSALLYPIGTLRAAPHILAQNEKGQSGLWAFGISGDYPILLVRIRAGESPLLIEALQAFTYWHRHHATINLVILNDQDTGYALDLHNTIQRQIRRMGLEDTLNQRDGIFILRADQLQSSDKLLLQAVAGVILDEQTGTLAEHAQRLTVPSTRLPDFIPSLARDNLPTTPQLQLPGSLLMGGMGGNGLGGFSPDGREYIIMLRPGQHTPHPWVNVIANPQFGFLISESGSGCTWAGNSGENRLTPWRNDPVTDLPGEVIYLRDEESGQIWSPTPMPAGTETTHLVRHGAGYSSFESLSNGLHQTLRLYALTDAPVKIARLRLQNLWQRPRRITVTYYAEWVLGTTRDAQQAQILPEYAPDRNALLASNPFNSEFGQRVAFLAANKKPHGLTADRTEFLGRMGSLSAPAALKRIGLASAVNAGLDPCAAIQLHVDLAPGASEEVYFLIGQGASRAESLAIIEQLQTEGQVETAWQTVQKQWDDILNAITVETPEPAMNLMLNRWLLYQTLSCRLWGRTALYQSSGAFGFRDQLQDVLALLHTRPDLVRAQILDAAGHQFEAGDVLHWWNPPSGRGVRTRFSDDLLWLPYVTAEYVAATGDMSILIARVPFLIGEDLKPNEMERYTMFETSQQAFSLYEHCRRALEKGATVGPHGIPLMGSGDWNDGMNRVGEHGRGESTWLGWFLHAALTRFAGITDLVGKDSAPYLRQADEYARALEEHTWDGEWYLRAFYDDGSKLGSSSSLPVAATEVDQECQIDSIAQSWAVLSGAADPLRAAQAMASVNRLLVKPAEQMILLFTPPFDKSPRDPGYIKGYMPGVRENGGQYTHAAIWTAWAFARLGQSELANELFRMLNPISHSDTAEKMARYKVEPYVIAADIYSRPPVTGRGGWTWYTGSSGWMYRLGLQAILGISTVLLLSAKGKPGRALKINPCIPGNWPGFKVNYHFGATDYKIEVVQTLAASELEDPHNASQGAKRIQVFLDGNLLPNDLVSLLDDGQGHEVRVFIGGDSISNFGINITPKAVQ